MSIYCANPGAQVSKYSNEIELTINRVLISGNYINGEEVKNFEEKFASYIGSKYAIGVSSGTSAIELVLRSLNLNNNDEVITVSHTAVPTVAAIRAANLCPKLVDIDPDTFIMDPDKLQIAISKKTKAVILVHLYGQTSNLDSIKKICDENSIYLVEDCSQAHGATWKSKKLGSYGIAGCFSCYPTKNLGGLGDAGIVTTNNISIRDNIRLLKEYGWKKRGESIIDGANHRLDEIQAAILSLKLNYLDSMNEARSVIAEQYKAKINYQALNPKSAFNSSHVYHLYVIKMSNRKEFLLHLNENGIYPGIHYAKPVHLQPAYRSLSHSDLKNTEKVCDQIVSLPIYPELSLDNVNFICTKINDFFNLTN